MPIRAPRICVCGNLIAGSAVCICRQRAKAVADKRRPSATARGYDGKWQRESNAYLAQPENRLCACACGRVADMVDHIIPHRGDMKLFWRRSNWQPMAASPCHNSRKQSLERRNSNIEVS
jgi:5-methylcytosine-specific restriction protein A